MTLPPLPPKSQRKARERWERHLASCKYCVPHPCPTGNLLKSEWEDIRAKLKARKDLHRNPTPA